LQQETVATVVILSLPDKQCLHRKTETLQATSANRVRNTAR